VPVRIVWDQISEIWPKNGLPGNPATSYKIVDSQISFMFCCGVGNCGKDGVKHFTSDSATLNLQVLRLVASPVYYYDYLNTFTS